MPTDTNEEIQKELETAKTKLNELEKKVQSGELIEAAKVNEAISEKVKAGDLYTKQSYNGLQKTTDKKDLELKAALEKTSELESALGILNTEKTTITTDLQKLQTEKDELELRLAADAGKLMRSSIIFNEFPQLAIFEADNLLPEFADEKELRDLLTKFDAKVGQIQKSALDVFQTGGGKMPPGGKDNKTTSTAQAHLDAAKNAIAKGDLKTYNTEYDAYQAALKELPPTK